MSMPMKDIISSIVILLFGVSFMFLSSELPVRNIQNVPGPAFFPGIISFFTVALSLGLLVKGLRGLRELPAAIPHTSFFPFKAVAVIGLFVILLAVLPYTGFLIAVSPFFAALMILCDNRKPVQIVLGSVLIPVFIYYLFRHGFNIYLPAGPWM